MQRATRRLDTGDPAEIAAYETAFYRGFERATHNRLVRWLWDWDCEAGRLRTRIGYDDQRIWVLPGERGLVTAGIAVNVRLKQLQASAFGFGVPQELREEAEAGRVCEILTLFAVGDGGLGWKLPLWREVFADLRAEGFTHALATTAPKMLPLYRFIRARILGQAEIEGETRFFLQFDLSRIRRN
jgi:hypothetical protein